MLVLEPSKMFRVASVASSSVLTDRTVLREEVPDLGLDKKKVL